VTQDIRTRYSKKEIGGGRLQVVKTGPGRKMLDAERKLVEEQPGPLNKEPWADTKSGRPEIER
jgi:hypothetical protein